MRSSPSSASPLAGGRLAEVGAALAAQPFVRRGVPATTETIRVVLADDHTVVREGLRLLLRSPPDIEVVGEAADGIEVVQVARRLNPDLVVLDLEMPGAGGVAAATELHRHLPGVRVLILTVHAESERLLELLEAGARGYLTKDAAAAELVDAIRVVASGEVYVRPSVARLLANALATRDSTETPRHQFDALSERERAVLQRIAEGYSLTEIAAQLGISRKTVDAYKRRIEAKLGLTHRTDYVKFALEACILVS